MSASSSGSGKGKEPMPPPPPPAAKPTVENLPPPDPVKGGSSKASDDGGSVKGGSVAGDSASDAGMSDSTALSAGTLASGASTAFFSEKVHFFSLDDFAGHAIQTILEDGENEQANDEPAADGGSADYENQSVRPGSIVSNLEQRLDDIDVFGGDADGGGTSSHGETAAGSSSGSISREQQYLLLLQEMQHRELTPADLQLLMRLEQERESLETQQLGMHPAGPGVAMGPTPTQLGARGPTGGGPMCSPPPVPVSNDRGSSSSSSSKNDGGGMPSES